MKPLTIGQVARKAGVGVETVRFYERQGLLQRPDRKASGYRLFGPAAVARLRFIRRAKELGFTLREINDLLDLRAGNTATRADVRRRAEQKVADLDTRIRDLQRMREALIGLIAACHGDGPAEECPILRAIDPPDDEAPADDGAWVSATDEGDHDHDETIQDQPKLRQLRGRREAAPGRRAVGRAVGG
jgi:MerR family copper efflux transcriptional regulator